MGVAREVLLATDALARASKSLLGTLEAMDAAATEPVTRRLAAGGGVA
jgi:hypothetical protein